MAKEVAGLLGTSVASIAKAIQWIAGLIAVIAFRVFFALAPLHSLILVGFLMVLASFAFKAEAAVQKTALYLGAAFMLLGVAGIFVPSWTQQLLNLARQLRQLMWV